MPYAVHYGIFLAEGIEDDAYGVADSAYRKPDDAGKRKHGQKYAHGENHHPAHYYIAYLTEDLDKARAHITKVKQDADGSGSPFNSHNDATYGIIPQAYGTERSIAACYKQKYS